MGTPKVTQPASSQSSLEVSFSLHPELLVLAILPLNLNPEPSQVASLRQQHLMRVLGMSVSFPVLLSFPEPSLRACEREGTRAAPH